MSIPFDEYAHSPKGSYRGLQYVIKRMGTTAYEDIDAFRQELMPPTVTFGTNQNQFFGAALPNDPRFRVTAFDWQPLPGGQLLGTDGFGMPLYELAEWVIEYQIPVFEAPNTPNNPDPVGFLTHEWTGGGEFLTLENQSLAFKTSTEFVPAGPEVKPGIFIPTVEMNVTWDRVVNPNFAIISDLIGKVNNNYFQLRTGIAEPETLLFLAPHLTQQIMSDGAKAYKVGFKFSKRKVPAADGGIDGNNIGGWNHYWWEGDSSLDALPGFHKVFRSYGGSLLEGQSIYTLADFTTMWDAGTALGNPEE